MQGNSTENKSVNVLDSPFTDIRVSFNLMIKNAEKYGGIGSVGYTVCYYDHCNLDFPDMPKIYGQIMRNELPIDYILDNIKKVQAKKYNVTPDDIIPMTWIDFQKAILSEKKKEIEKSIAERQRKEMQERAAKDESFRLGHSTLGNTPPWEKPDRFVPILQPSIEESRKPRGKKKAESMPPQTDFVQVKIPV